MKCANCGAEIKVGCLYCSICGAEAQVVSDSSLLEEELLRELLQDETTPVKKEPSSEKKNPKKNQKKNHKSLIITLSVLGALLVMAITVFLIFDNQRRNSYGYQVEKAQEYTAEKDYNKALNFYKKAIELNKDDMASRVEMARIYVIMEDEISAVNLLKEIISLDEDNVDAYRLLIELYAKKNDYESILKLEETIKDQKLLELFSEYGVVKPKFSLEPGVYKEFITIELSAEKGNRIYYTLDGSDPTKNGDLYDKPLELDEQGSYELKAAACNEYGVYSEVAGGTYNVELSKPQMAKAVPDSGTFYMETTVTLIGIEDCRMYYTWDGTIPTTESQEYTEPIVVPEGNNILSVILVDKYGMISDVLRCNYIYMP